MTTVTGGITGQGSIARQLQDGIHAVFQTTYKDFKPQYTLILEIKSSKKAYEEDVPMAGFGLAPVKPEGQQIEYDAQQEATLKRYRHVVYAKGTIITEEAQDDGLYLDLGMRAGRLLKRSLVHTEEEVSADVFNLGYTTELLWDGLSVFNGSHKLIKGGTYSNLLDTPADLSEAALEDAIIAMRDFRDDGGLLINAAPQTLHIPAELMFTAERILGSSLQNDTANNAINAIRSMGVLPGGAHVNDRFTSLKNWFIRSDVDNGGCFFRRRDYRVGQDNDFGTSNLRWKCSTRFSVGVSDGRQYFGSGVVT